MNQSSFPGGHPVRTGTPEQEREVTPDKIRTFQPYWKRRAETLLNPIGIIALAVTIIALIYCAKAIISVIKAIIKLFTK